MPTLRTDFCIDGARVAPAVARPLGREGGIMGLEDFLEVEAVAGRPDRG